MKEQKANADAQPVESNRGRIASSIHGLGRGKREAESKNRNRWPVRVQAATSSSTVPQYRFQLQPLAVHCLSQNSIFCGYHAISIHCASSTSRIRAKFEKFQGEPPQDSFREAEPSSALENFEEDEEDDSCLPRDLEGAVRQSSQATGLFVSSGGMRAIVCTQVDNLVPNMCVRRALSLHCQLFPKHKIYQ